MVIGDAALGTDIGIRRARGAGLDAQWGLEIQCPAGSVQIMATEVAQIRAAEGPEVPPGNRKISRVKWPRLARPQPQVPIQAGRGRQLLLRAAGERGVPAERVLKFDELVPAIRRAIAADGPYLLDVHTGASGLPGIPSGMKIKKFGHGDRHVEGSWPS